MTLTFYTLFYILMSSCFIFPTSAFISAGLTISSIFYKWLGSEFENFVIYHIRRTVATILIHSFLPFGYVIGALCLESEGEINSLLSGMVYSIIFFITALIPCAAALLVCFWKKENWKYHPIAKTLSLFSNQNSTWESVASDINLEFRRNTQKLAYLKCKPGRNDEKIFGGNHMILQMTRENIPSDGQLLTEKYSSLYLQALHLRVDKFCLNINSIEKVIATDNWVLKLTPYGMNCAHQSDTALILTKTDTHGPTPGNPVGLQFLNIEVKSTRTNVPSFKIRLNSMAFQDLQDKVIRPITILQNVSFHRSLSDHFLEVFRQLVGENSIYRTNEVLEPCIGCMQNISNVKLQKQCVNSQGRPSCTPCFCRPMWCIECMGRWFASRQDQEHPETWLDSQCTCPMCRNIFCMLDICIVQTR